jgi:magnesium transporter
VDAAKIDDYESYLFLVVQALTHYQPYAELEAVEVDFYLGSNYVVSCHQQPVPAIELFREHCLRDDNVLNHTADWVLHGLLDALVDEYLPIVDAVDDTIDDLETQILHRAETTQLHQLLLIKRNALRLRRATIPQRDIMNRLSRGEFSALIRPEMGIYFRDIYDHLVRIEYLVDALRDLADGALQTYLSVVSNRLNEVMKLLTAAATIFLPLTLISGVYGMNFEENQFPSFSAPWGFAAVVGSMLAIAIGLLVFFRLRRWV